ncbi:MAG: exodeoxyribonuclease VII large subunit [Peptococcaceae bacterium]|nr:exodeoxyribonuclease VII large subunit [Peptococcaceae bacterium]
MSNSDIVKVSVLNDYIKTLFDTNDVLQNIRVEGEISNFKRHAASGHCYFSIKDEKAAINCVMFRSAAQQLRTLPQNGQAVIAQGSVSVYTKSGSYQLYVQRLLPVGVGNLQIQYERLKEKLAAEGVFKNEQTRRPLPVMPKKIGIVTSPTGAVIRDMLRVLRRRWLLVDVLLVPASVQGQEGARSIETGLRALYARDDIDVIIVGRGGGSLEDLWNFNEENVVRTIAESPVPIISAVGHETDVTLSDFAADVRAGTPSMAAELAVPDGAQVRTVLEERRMLCDKHIGMVLNHKRHVLQGFLSGGILQDTEKLLATYHLQLDQRWSELVSAMQNVLHEKQKRFRENVSKLDAMSPLKVLARGYSFCEKEGQAVQSVKQVMAGDRLTLHFADGDVESKVLQVSQKRIEE